MYPKRSCVRNTSTGEKSQTQNRMQTKGKNLPQGSLVVYNPKVWVKQIQWQMNVLIWQNLKLPNCCIPKWSFYSQLSPGDSHSQSWNNCCGLGRGDPHSQACMEPRPYRVSIHAETGLHCKSPEQSSALHSSSSQTQELKRRRTHHSEVCLWKPHPSQSRERRGEAAFSLNNTREGRKLVFN